MSSTYRRRQATRSELAQGEDEMRRAQERFAAEAANGGELPIADQPQEQREEITRTVAEVAGQIEDVRSSDGAQQQIAPRTPRSSETRVSNVPAAPLTDPPARPPEEFVQVSIATPQTEAPPRSNVQSPADQLRDQVGRQTGDQVSAEVQQTPQPQTGEMGRSTGLPPRESPLPAQTPLFSHEQLLHMAMMEQQATWLYPNRQLPPLLPHSMSQPMMGRPMFLPPEDTAAGQVGMVERPNSLPPLAPAPEVLRLTEENRKLKERLSLLEARFEDPRFKTPESQRGVQEAETTRVQEAAPRDNRRLLRRPRSPMSKEDLKKPCGLGWTLQECRCLTQWEVRCLRNLDNPTKDLVNSHDPERHIVKGTLLKASLRSQWSLCTLWLSRWKKCTKGSRKMRMVPSRE